jgi:23S rRNA (pseudouridine1915-N3)-methyltransferase
MKIRLIAVGKTKEEYIRSGFEEYSSRISRYVRFELILIPALKNGASLPEAELKKKEAEAILSKLGGNEFTVLLDEKGKLMDSVSFAKTIEGFMNRGVQEVVFITGGAYGVDEVVRRKSGLVLALSPMTFSHQLVRLIFAEQLYRALSIMKGEKYHH